MAHIVDLTTADQRCRSLLLSPAAKPSPVLLACAYHHPTWRQQPSCASLNATFRFLLTQPTIHHSFLQHQLHPSREALDCVHVLDGPDSASCLATLDPRLSPLSTRSFSFWSAPAHRLSSSTLQYTPGLVALPCLPASVPVRLIPCTAPFNTHPLYCARDTADPPSLPTPLCACVLAD